MRVKRTLLVILLGFSGAVCAQNAEFIDVEEYKHPELVRLDTLDAEMYLQEAPKVLSGFVSQNDWRGFAVLSGQFLWYRYTTERPENILDEIKDQLSLASKNLGDRHPDLFRNYLSIGRINQQQRKFLEALKYFEIAEKIGQNTYIEGGNDWRQLLRYFGQLYAYNLRDNYMANLYLGRMLDFENEYSDYNRAFLYYLTSTVKKAISDFESAEFYSFKALEAYRKVGGISLGTLYEALGNSQVKNKRYNLALQNFSKAAEIYLDDLGPDSQNLGFLSINQSEALLSMGFIEESIQVAQSGLRILDSAEVNDRLILNTNLASGYFELGNIGKAINILSQVLSRSNDTNVSADDLAFAHKTLGIFYLSLDKRNQAETEFLKSLFYMGVEDLVLEQNRLPLLKDIPSNAIVSEGLYGLADIQIDDGISTSDHSKIRKGFDLLFLADSVLFEAREVISTEGSELLLIDQSFEMYDFGVDRAFQAYLRFDTNEYIQYAHRLIESSKARMLQKKLLESRAMSVLPDSIEAINRDLQVTKSYLIMNQFELQRDEMLDSVAVLENSNRIIDISNRIDSLEAYIQRTHPIYFTLSEEMITASFTETQRLVESGNTLVEFFDGIASVYAIAIQNEQIEIVQLEKNEEYRDHFLEFLKSISTRNIDPFDQDAFKKYTTSAYWLYQQLLAPLIELDKDLIIIPHGELSLIPFEALISSAIENDADVNYKSLPYLITSVDIRYEHSASMMKLYQEMDSKIVNPSVAGLAFSESGNPASQILVDVLPELPGTAEEINGLKEVYTNGTYYSGRQATKEKALEGFQNDLLHLAVHGVADRSNRLGSSLIFKSENGYDSLFSYEIFSQVVKSSLVVLSACETGMGSLQTGEGVFNLARGFAYAGTPSVIMSLWQIDDISSASIMKSLYDFMDNGEDANNALQGAKLEYLKKSDRFQAHPSKWAPYIHYGKPTTFVNYRVGLILTIVTFLIFGSVLAFRWTLKRKVR